MRQGSIYCIGLLSPMLLAQASTAPTPAPTPQIESSTAVPAQAWQFVTLANQARATAGLAPLQWDAALATAAHQHCQRMAAEGNVSHRYAGEPDLSQRAAQAGAHFSLIEENVAVGAAPAAIHEQWMGSPEHRFALLSPDVDQVGVGVVASGDALYVVADFARAVPALSQAQVEAAIAGLLRAKGISVLDDPTEVRVFCALPRGAKSSGQAGYLIRWQDADLTQLPQSLVDHIKSGDYKKGAVGSCPPHDVEDAFTVYRVAVFLY